MLKKHVSGRFLHYYTDHTGYEFVSRKPIQTFCEGNKDPDAVVIVATRYGSFGYEVVLIREKRQPTGDYVVSFPAGLIDSGETPEQAAVREFAEETGLELEGATLLKDNAFTSPGMSDEINAIVIGTFSGQINPEKGIDVFVVNMDDLTYVVQNNNVTAKLATFTAALKMASLLPVYRGTYNGSK